MLENQEYYNDSEMHCVSTSGWVLACFTICDPKPANFALYFISSIVLLVPHGVDILAICNIGVEICHLQLGWRSKHQRKSVLLVF